MGRQFLMFQNNIKKDNFTSSQNALRDTQDAPLA